MLASLSASLCLESPGKEARLTGVLMKVGRLVTDLNSSLTTLPSPEAVTIPAWATVTNSDPAPFTETKVHSSQNCEVPENENYFVALISVVVITRIANTIRIFFAQRSYEIRGIFDVFNILIRGCWWCNMIIA